MQWSTIKAIDIVHGDYVSFDGDVKKVGSTHYSGMPNGHGLVTLCFTDATERIVRAQSQVRYIGD